ncbi:hypothetical protein [Gimesia chilikensis]|uniref:hypothetical protein n=1 Tax=Gimesia chilikensis TaxID=2605989 RepID=UPI0011A1324D|nr:hypothetical protein [Gimesia chilikensis]
MLGRPPPGRFEGGDGRVAGLLPPGLPVPVPGREISGLPELGLLGRVLGRLIEGERLGAGREKPPPPPRLNPPPLPPPRPPRP